jgi:hypothetical protein
MLKLPALVYDGGMILMRFIPTLLARPATHIIMGFGILLLDLSTGPVLMFPIMFVLPVALSALFCSARLAYAMAGALPFGTFLISHFVDSQPGLAVSAINAVVRVVVLCILAFLAARNARLSREIKVLHGRLPICMWCKSIRKPDGIWQKLEKYIAENSEADFTHGLCPDCLEKHYGEWLGKKPVPISPAAPVA